MTTILLGIDGTGAFSDAQYARDFRHSFVHEIYTRSPAREKHYLRGPAETLGDFETGSDTVFLASQGYAYLHLHYSAGDRVLLAGYSRGAAAVVAVAQRLVGRQIPVAGLLLFDCVDRCPLVDTRTVPANVEEVIHVMRDPLADSREWFGNSGLRAEPPTIYNGHRIRQSGEQGHRVVFFGTHGAMGGVPWRSPDEADPHPEELIDERGLDGMTRVTYARDLECSREVWGAVHPALCRLGFL